MTRLATLEELFPDHVAGLWGGEAGTLEHNVRIIRNGDVQTDGSVRWDQLPIRAVSLKEFAKSKVQVGDLLLTTSGNCARVAYVDRDDDDVCASNFTRRLRVDPVIADARYLFHLMRGERFRELCAPYIRGTTLENLSVKDAFATVRLPVPAIEEQQRIASILDAADVLRAKRRQAIEKVDNLAQAIFADMFGNPSLSRDRWPYAELAEVVAVGTSVTYGIVQAGEEYEGGVPYIRTGDIVEGAIRLDGLRHTDPAIAARFPRSRVRAGEIVMSIRATVGTTALVPEQLEGANLTQGTARIAPGNKTESTYLLTYLRTPAVQQWIQRQVKGATFREITLARLRELPVLLPPIDLQHDFAKKISAVERIQLEQLRAGSFATRLFRSLQHRAFQGEL